MIEDVIVKLKNKKLTYNFVKNSFEKEGYTLVSKEYVNNHTKLEYICPKGHKNYTIWLNWNRGHRCPTCAGQTKPTIAEVRHLFEKENYLLLDTTYKNAHTKLTYICPKGHKHSMSCTNWKSGYRCPTCANINNSGPGASNWKGGVSFETYCEAWRDKEYKQDIKNRDGNRCLNPYCYKTDNVLTVHHIDYNKKNCKPNNLITVCRACNSRANKDRAWHKAWYQAIIYRRYGNINNV